KINLDISHPDMENLHIEWYRDGGQIAEDVTQIDIDDDGIYKVVAGNKKAFDYCFSEMTFSVDYYANRNCVIPEGLSPNNDGYNDYLDLAFLSDKSGIAFIKIFNRYGTEVYSKNNYVDEWEGQSDNGNTLPVGTYYYIIRLKDNSEDIKGYI